MTNELAEEVRATDRPLRVAVKAVSLLMIGGAILKIAPVVPSLSQTALGLIAFTTLWGLIGVCGLGVLLRSDVARLAGGVLLSMTALLYFLGLALFVVLFFAASFGNNQPGSATGQFLSLLFTPLIALVCAKVLFGVGSIARPKAGESTPTL